MASRLTRRLRSRPSSMDRAVYGESSITDSAASRADITSGSTVQDVKNMRQMRIGRTAFRCIVKDTTILEPSGGGDNFSIHIVLYKHKQKYLKNDISSAIGSDSYQLTSTNASLILKMKSHTRSYSGTESRQHTTRIALQNILQYKSPNAYSGTTLA